MPLNPGILVSAMEKSDFNVCIDSDALVPLVNDPGISPCRKTRSISVNCSRIEAESSANSVLIFRVISTLQIKAF